MDVNSSSRHVGMEYATASEKGLQEKSQNHYEEPLSEDMTNTSHSNGGTGGGGGMRPLKITTVGDGMVGKTCMLITYTRNEFPTEYVPTVFDNHACTIVIDGTDYSLTLWDTAGQEDYERLRPLSYPNTACFLICYSISSRTSYDNVLSKWWPEVRSHMPNAPIVLVGTKSDLRVPGSEKFVTTAEGKKMKHKIKAYALVECSAKRKENLHEVFEEAVRAAEKRPHVGQRSCTIL